jgi:hypothetical protein
MIRDVPPHISGADEVSRDYTGRGGNRCIHCLSIGVEDQVHALPNVYPRIAIAGCWTICDRSEAGG